MSTKPFNAFAMAQAQFDKIADLIGLEPGTRALLRSPLREILRVPVTRRPQWDADTRQWVLGQVREDNVALLAHCGQPPDLWQLEA